ERLYADLTLAPSSVTVLHAAVHKALRKAVKDKLLLVNPASDIERVKPEKDAAIANAQQHCWSEAEARRIVVAAKATGGQLGAFVLVAFDSGARKSELHGLSWEHVDLETGVITIARQLDSVKLSEAGAVRFGPTKTK